MGLFDFFITKKGGDTTVETADGQKIDLGNPKTPSQEVLTDPQKLNEFDKDFKSYLDELPAPPPLND